ncbi:MAG TPA: toxic anion resistance protein [Rectinemataceae bacterium]|nr:toxic anion resistance protein [Rectinemataceae bacterium]
MSDTALQPSQAPLDLARLAPEDLARAQEIAKGISIDDSQAIVQYGVGAQGKISGFADTMLDQIRAKDSGFVGEVLTGLVLKIKEVDVGSLGSGSSFLSGIPFLGSLVDSVKKFIARYEKLSVQIEKIVQELEDSRMTLLRDITMLDGLYNKNLEYLKELDLYVAAGQIRIEELRRDSLPGFEAKAKASSDPMDAQRLSDFNQFLNRFEKKLYDLKLSRMVAVQTAPQIRLIQNNDQALVEKVQSSIMTTIPLWKSQIVIAISLFRQKKALEVQKEVTDTTNELLSRNAELLKDSSLGIAKESERGIVEIETLKKVNDDLIATIEETLKIQAEGREKRAQAETELRKIESDLKARLAGGIAK